jgi:hypothetical protein
MDTLDHRRRAGRDPRIGGALSLVIIAAWMLGPLLTAINSSCSATQLLRLRT